MQDARLNPTQRCILQKGCEAKVMFQKAGKLHYKTPLFMQAAITENHAPLATKKGLAIF